MRTKQTDLFEYFDMKDVKRRFTRTQHGGANTKCRRKTERPLSTKKWIHLVLKSDKAKGRLSFLHANNQRFVEQTLKHKAKKYGVRLAEMVNVGSHLHLKIKITTRKTFQNFLRATTALIARHVTGARKNKPYGRFWQGLAFNRVLRTSLEELNLRGYLEANRVEATHDYSAREAYLEQFNAWVKKQRRRRSLS